jgi:hypothetical protein
MNLSIRTRSQHAKAGIVVNYTNVCVGSKDVNKRIEEQGTDELNSRQKISIAAEKRWKNKENKHNVLRNLRAGQKCARERFNHAKTVIIALIDEVGTFVQKIVENKMII